MKKQEFNIIGMHCASCSAIIQKGLAKTDGITDSNVNFATNKAFVTYDESKLDDTKIIDVIKNRGYGAEIYSEKKKELLEHERLAKTKKLFLVSLVFAIPAFIIGMILMPLKIDIPYAEYILFILATPVQFYVGTEIYKSAWASLKNKTSNMDTLIAIGTSAAYFFSVYSIFFNPELGQYFETSAILITFVMLGRYLEAVAKGKTSEAIKKLMQLTPKTATVIRKGKELIIDIDDVLVNDIILVKPGERISVDGIIIEGSSSIDESMITGESIPAEKHKGDNVTGGTINKHGSFKFKATKIGKDTTLSHIIKLVEEAQGRKAPIQRFADAISSYFVPIVIIIAILTFIAWFFLFNKSFSFSMITAVAVLVIACPCALGLATPTAILVGTGKGAKNGILIKGGDSLEATHKSKYVLFDKTGTITEGKPVVTDIIIIDKKYNDKKLLTIAGSIEKNSEHPLADAIVEESQNKTKYYNIIFQKTSGFRAIPGYGINAKIGKQNYFFGNKRLMEKNKIKITPQTITQISKLESEGKTVMILADKNIIGLIAVADTMKITSRNAIVQLKQMGLQVYMITGDNERTAKAIAKQTGIDENNVFAEVLPNEKADYVKKLQQKGKTIMVGDGINDAPALAQADIGIAMGSGTDVAMETGNVVLMKNDLMDIPKAIRLSRLTMNKIKQNMFWALFYNVLGIPIAAGLLYPFTGWLLSPIIAGGAMALSSVSVVTNSLLLKQKKL